MEIVSVVIERADEKRYCGLMNLCDDDGEARIWWSLESLDDRRARVGFIQGDRDDWLDQVQQHALAYSDTILAGIAEWRRPQLLDLAG